MRASRWRLWPRPGARFALPGWSASAACGPRGRQKLAASETDPARFFHALRRALPDDVLFSWDGGDFAHWGRAILPARHAGGWLRLGPLGTIGSSLPNALALQLAHPGRRVVAITGDGALGFYLAEMDTAVRFKLPIVLIVGNDAGWGLERELQSWAARRANGGLRPAIRPLRPGDEGLRRRWRDH